jgi:hypothetical protein
MFGTWPRKEKPAACSHTKAFLVESALPAKHEVAILTFLLKTRVETAHVLNLKRRFNGGFAGTLRIKSPVGHGISKPIDELTRDSDIDGSTADRIPISMTWSVLWKMK